MTIYVDTPALLRLILREPGAILDLQACESLVSSELTAIEAMRTLDRMRREWLLSTDEAMARRTAISEWLEAIDIVQVRGPVLARAAEPFPVPLGTVTAIHLATALLWREHTKQPLAFATHDSSVAFAARAFGFDVLGS